MVVKLLDAVKPIQLINKVNEIIDNLEGSYTGYNPILQPDSGTCTWVVTHNLGTENVNCAVYKNDVEALVGIEVASENAIVVTFNSDTNVPAETFKVVVLADGGVGSGSGGGDITVDSSLSTTSTNPVQNKVITNYVQPALDNFLPNNTVINVKTDGTGDFTKLSDAITYLNSKWSSGQVTIQLGEGTFIESSNISIDASKFSKLTIKGVSRTSTTIKDSRVSLTNNQYLLSVTGGVVLINNLKVLSVVENLNGYESLAILAQESSVSCEVRNIAVDGFETCLYSAHYLTLRENIDISNATQGIRSRNGLINSTWNPKINLTNVDTGIAVRYGGSVHLSNPTFTMSNVTHQYAQALNSVTGDGWITV